MLLILMSGEHVSASYKSDIFEANNAKRSLWLIPAGLIKKRASNETQKALY